MPLHVKVERFLEWWQSGKQLERILSANQDQATAMSQLREEKKEELGSLGLRKDLKGNLEPFGNVKSQTSVWKRRWQTELSP